MYRLIFGGIKGDARKDREVVEAYERVNRALEGLDRDVLILMQAALKAHTANDLADTIFD